MAVWQYGSMAVWQYGSDNRLLQMGFGNELTLFSYTANGHIAQRTTASEVREYQYDASDRLVSVQSNGVEIARYQHDPFGRRISKTINGETTWYLYSNEGLIAELDGTGKMLVAYGWQPDTMFGTAPLWQTNIAPGQTLQTAPVHYLYTDHLGTPVMAVNAKGQVTWKGQHEAFGKMLESDGNQIVMNLRFPGQYYDRETDSHYNYMRDYNPELGNYQQRDPIGLNGGINPRGYVEANPLIYSDPQGLYAMAVRAVASSRVCQEIFRQSVRFIGTNGSALIPIFEENAWSEAVAELEGEGIDLSDIDKAVEDAIKIKEAAEKAEKDKEHDRYHEICDWKNLEDPQTCSWAMFNLNKAPECARLRENWMDKWNMHDKKHIGELAAAKRALDNAINQVRIYCR